MYVFLKKIIYKINIMCLTQKWRENTIATLTHNLILNAFYSAMTFCKKLVLTLSDVPGYTCTSLHLHQATLLSGYTCTRLHLYQTILVPAYTCRTLHLYQPTLVPAYTCTRLHLYHPTLAPDYTCTRLHL